MTQGSQTSRDRSAPELNLFGLGPTTCSFRSAEQNEASVAIQRSPRSQREPDQARLPDFRQEHPWPRPGADHPCLPHAFSSVRWEPGRACDRPRCSSSQLGSPKAPDLEAQKVPEQGPDSRRDAGTPCRNSPFTLSRVALKTRQSAANVSPPITVSPPSGGRRRETGSMPSEMRFAASISVRPSGRAGKITQHPDVSSVVRTRSTKRGLVAIGANQSGRAAPRTST
jgi:hypothetical protein